MPAEDFSPLWKAIRVAKPDEARTPLKDRVFAVIIAKTPVHPSRLIFHTPATPKAEKKVPDRSVNVPRRLKELNP